MQLLLSEIVVTYDPLFVFCICDLLRPFRRRANAGLRGLLGKSFSADKILVKSFEFLKVVG